MAETLVAIVAEVAVNVLFAGRDEFESEYFYGFFDLRKYAKKGGDVASMAAQLRRICKGTYTRDGWSAVDDRKGVIVLGRFLFVSAPRGLLKIVTNTVAAYRATIDDPARKNSPKGD